MTRRAFAPRAAEVGWTSLPEAERLRFCEQLLGTLNAANVARSGDEIALSCPLPFGAHAHGDRRPSAHLNWRKGLFNCFGCGSGGDLSWLVATCKGTTEAQARAEVAALGPDGTDLDEMIGWLDRVWAPPPEVAFVMPRYSMRVLDPWLAERHPYVAERGIPEDRASRFMVGWDRTTDRLVIPHVWDGGLVGWQSRRLSDDGSPKYLSSAQFPKDRTLFGHDPTAGEAVVVESPMSVLVRPEHPPLVATFGASVTDRQARLLSGYGKVTLAFDPDPAGWAATERLGGLLGAYTEVWVIGHHWNADPADMTADQYATACADRVPFGAWRRPAFDLPPLPRDGG